MAVLIERRQKMLEPKLPPLELYANANDLMSLLGNTLTSIPAASKFFARGHLDPQPTEPQDVLKFKNGNVEGVVQYRTIQFPNLKWKIMNLEMSYPDQINQGVTRKSKLHLSSTKIGGAFDILTGEIWSNIEGLEVVNNQSALQGALRLISRLS